MAGIVSLGAVECRCETAALFNVSGWGVTGAMCCDGGGFEVLTRRSLNVTHVGRFSVLSCTMAQAASFTQYRMASLRLISTTGSSFCFFWQCLFSGPFIWVEVLLTVFAVSGPAYALTCGYDLRATPGSVVRSVEPFRKRKKSFRTESLREVWPRNRGECSTELFPLVLRLILRRLV